MQLLTTCTPHALLGHGRRVVAPGAAAAHPSSAGLAAAGTAAALVSPAHTAGALLAAHAPAPPGLQSWGAKGEELERDSAWFVFSP